MNDCPDYRLRLFLSVDLVGSTAFKANPSTAGSDLHPLWVERFKHFYQEFPRILETRYRDSISCRNDGLALTSGPKLWKLIGDEILFCCRIHSLQHLSCVTLAFLDALEKYGEIIDDDPQTASLDVKGAGWVAAFPAENVSLKIEGGNIRSTVDGVDYLTERFEADADDHPAPFDFIGPAIDAGFRSSKSASSDRFSSSIELAYLLAEASSKNFFPRPFSYHGRSPLKGVHKNEPYPVISINSERDPRKRDLLTRERVLTGEHEVPALNLREFLNAYLNLHGLERPMLKLKNDSMDETPPASYDAFRKSWEVSSKGTREQDNSINEAEKADPNKLDSIPLNAAIEQFAHHRSANSAKASKAHNAGQQAEVAQQGDVDV